MNRFLKELLPPVVRNKGLSEAELKKLSTYNIFKVEGTRNTYGGPIQYYDLDILKPLNLEKIYAGRIIHKFITEYNNGVLVDFIKRMQADNVYVCCSFGYRETHQALMLNQYLNPLYKDKREYDTGMRFALLSNMLDFCDEVTLAQKKKIGWTEEFETNLRKKLNKEIDRYCKL